MGMAISTKSLQDSPDSLADTVQRLGTIFVDGGGWLTADHPLQDGRAVAAIQMITIADTDHSSDSWFKTKILGGLNGADVEFIDPVTNDGEYGIVAVHLTTPSGVVTLD